MILTLKERVEYMEKAGLLRIINGDFVTKNKTSIPKIYVPVDGVTIKISYKPTKTSSDAIITIDSIYYDGGYMFNSRDIFYNENNQIIEYIGHDLKGKNFMIYQNGVEVDLELKILANSYIVQQFIECQKMQSRPNYSSYN